MDPIPSNPLHKPRPSLGVFDDDRAPKIYLPRSKDRQKLERGGEDGERRGIPCVSGRVEVGPRLRYTHLSAHTWLHGDKDKPKDKPKPARLMSRGVDSFDVAERWENSRREHLFTELCWL